MDECDKELQSAHTTDDQMLVSVADDVNACQLETEHVHKVCLVLMYSVCFLTTALFAFVGVTYLFLVCISHAFGPARSGDPQRARDGLLLILTTSSYFPCLFITGRISM